MGLSAGVVMLFVLPLFASSEDKIHIDQFISPDTCSGCHSEIFEQWENSMHSLAHKDPVYFKVARFLRKGLTDEGQIKEAESCVKCHTPIGYLTGFPKKLSDDLSKTAEIATQAIQCDYCHSAVTVKQMYNNGLVLKPGQGEDDPGIKYGPFDDAAPDFHEAQYSKLHTESEICGTCHDVKHVVFGTDLETTYTEWKNSPYNSKDPQKKITCQGCHMYQRPGIPATGSTPRPENPGAATDYSD
ncbi:MAG: cytochrome c554 family protein, partial [Desulfobacula sp.]|nr:cytochrome c554 family protein [Desulfobacula sp.]